VEAGAIAADGVTRRFRVRPHGPRTLRAVLGLKRSPPTEIWALRDVSFVIEPGQAVGLIGRNGSGKTTLLQLVAGILGPTSGRLTVGGTVGTLLELGAGFQPELTGRENVYLSASLHGLRRSYVQEHLEEIVAFAQLEPFVDLPVRTYSAGMYMRLGFALAMHLQRNVVLLDEVFAVGDEAFQRKCFGKILEFKQRGGTIMFVSHAAAAVERLCERAILLRAGRVAFDGAVGEALAHYQRILADDEAPAERAAGLREWGSGEARITDVRLEGSGGEERSQFLSGEPFVLRLRIEATEELPPPRLSVEIRDLSGLLLGAAAHDLGDLGWNQEEGLGGVRFEVERLPFADGRFYVTLSLSARDGGRLYHGHDRAAEFLVYPRGEARGLVYFDGRWSATSAEGFRSTTRS
jgi:ABC-type polysaccharide/polyol phosphate transport system ATPase subunit